MSAMSEKAAWVGRLMSGIVFLVVLIAISVAILAHIVREERRKDTPFGRRFANRFVAGIFLPLLVIFVVLLASALRGLP